MQYMIIVKSGRDCEAGKTPSDAILASVGKYTQELRRAGVLVELSRLEPSSKGTRIKFSSGNRMIVDGPFAETRELIGGYWIIQAESKEEAIQWAKRVPAPEWGVESEIEVRQFLAVESYAPGAALEGTGAGPELARSHQQGS
jgi:hypothetical protein